MKLLSTAAPLLVMVVCQKEVSMQPEMVDGIGHIPRDQAESERSWDRASHAGCPVCMQGGHSASQWLRLMGRGRSASLLPLFRNEFGAFPTSRYSPALRVLFCMRAGPQCGVAPPGLVGAFGRPLRSSNGGLRAVLPGRIAVAQICLQLKRTHAYTHTHSHMRTAFM